MSRFDLASILAPLPVEAFKGEILASHPLLPGETAVDPARARLFDWDALNQVLAIAAAVCSPGPDGPVEVMVAGRRLGPEALCRPSREGERRRIDPARLTHALRAGGRLSLLGVEVFDPRVAGLCDDISRRLRVAAQADIQACWSSPQPPRFEAAPVDRLVIQLAGRRRWDVRSPDGEPVAAGGALEPGAVAYVPRGWSVRAVPLEQPAMQMVISLVPSSEDALRRWAAARLLEADPSLREPLPEDPQARAAEEAALLARLATACADPALRARFQDEEDAAAMEPRPAFGLPWTGTRGVLPPEDVVLRLTGPRPPLVRPTQDGAEYRMRGKRFELSAAVAAALSPLFEGQAASVGELLAAGPAEAVREALADLLLAGCAAPEPGARGRVRCASSGS